MHQNALFVKVFCFSYVLCQPCFPVKEKNWALSLSTNDESWSSNVWVDFHNLSGIKATALAKFRSAVKLKALKIWGNQPMSHFGRSIDKKIWVVLLEWRENCSICSFLFKYYLFSDLHTYTFTNKNGTGFDVKQCSYAIHLREHTWYISYIKSNTCWLSKHHSDHIIIVCCVIDNRPKLAKRLHKKLLL